MSPKQQLLEDLSRALSRLADASERLRLRLDQIDPYEQPAKWAATSDQLRGLDERISRLRDAQQRLSLAALELPALAHADIEILRAATLALAELVRTSATAGAVAEAAGKLATIAGEIVKKTFSQG